jgi:hypothetical protein
MWRVYPARAARAVMARYPRAGIVNVSLLPRLLLASHIFTTFPEHLVPSTATPRFRHKFLTSNGWPRAGASAVDSDAVLDRLEADKQQLGAGAR